MKRHALITPCIAILTMLGLASEASAAWNNVFQVCCHDCRPRTRTAFFRDTTPAPEKRVEYQRSYYYEPITVMKPERFTEEVPVKVKSYYYEPVTTYTRSSYYDPCSGCYQDIAVPRTSYVRKEECSTVMRYVERIRMVPVQTQRKVESIRPVVTYYYPEQRRYVADCDLPQAGAPTVTPIPSGPPGVSTETIMPQNFPTTPGGGVSTPRVMPPAKVNARTTSRQASPAIIHGEVVKNDQVTPQSRAKLVFISVTDLKRREYISADEFGHFDVKLPAGKWHMYVGPGDGQANFQKTIQVQDTESRKFLVVSR